MKEPVEEERRKKGERKERDKSGERERETCCGTCFLKGNFRSGINTQK